MDKLERLLLCAVLVVFAIEFDASEDFFSTLLFDAQATVTVSLGPISFLLCVAAFVCFVDYTLSKSKTDATKFAVTFLTGYSLVRFTKFVFW